jgi:hypothetical protein
LRREKVGKKRAISTINNNKFNFIPIRTVRVMPDGSRIYSGFDNYGGEEEEEEEKEEEEEEEEEEENKNVGNNDGVNVKDKKKGDISKESENNKFKSYSVESFNY